jgi:hypothetical protein
MKYDLALMDIIPDDIEKGIIKELNLKAPECYGEITKKEREHLEEVIKKEKYKKYKINIEIINSIRSSYVKNKMIKEHHLLKKNTKNIINDYNKNIDILKLSKKYNGSPLNIMRMILSSTNTKKNIKKIFNNPTLLNEKDKREFKLAKENDIFALVNQNEVLIQSMLFEKDIEKILIKNNIVYKTQEELVKEQIKLFGHPINTPDFLILSELIINNKTIKWIDAKKFYGSNINFVKRGIEEQTKKYIEKYGDGCIIFNLGFNENYNNNKNILFLSWNLFNKI